MSLIKLLYFYPLGAGEAELGQCSGLTPVSVPPAKGSLLGSLRGALCSVRIAGSRQLSQLLDELSVQAPFFWFLSHRGYS